MGAPDELIASSLMAPDFIKTTGHFQSHWRTSPLPRSVSLFKITAGSQAEITARHNHPQSPPAARSPAMLPTRITRITLLALTVAWCCSVALAQDAAPAAKKRVAVMNFDYGTVRSYVSSIFGSDQDVGKGISDLLVQKLVQDGKYSVIERNALDKILAEQNFSNSDRADAATAAKIGKVLGVDAIIIGSITQFGRDDQHTNVGGGGYGLGKFGLGGVGTSKAKAVVGISARMVNTSTGEILAAVTR